MAIFSAITYYFADNFCINLTNSLPIGIYKKTSNQKLQIGDYVVFYLPQEVSQKVANRAWFDKDTSLLKKVGGIAGDTYYAQNDSFYVKNSFVAKVYDTDKQGLALPQLSSGIKIVEQGCFLPISTQITNSFDARYYGHLSNSQIKFKVEPFLIWPDSFLK